MIHVYGLGWRMPEYIKKSTESILKNASEPINFTIIDNLSHKSTEIIDWAKNMKAEGKINNIVSLKENILGLGYIVGYEALPPDDSEDFFVFTDLDLIVPDGLDWIAETRKAREDKKIIITGFGLGLSNYTDTPNYGHNPDPDGHAMGMWLMGINRKIFDAHYSSPWFTDGTLTNTLKKHGTNFRIRKDLYHLGWDLWRDDIEYWEMKKKGVNWNITKKCEYEEIQ